MGLYNKLVSAWAAVTDPVASFLADGNMRLLALAAVVSLMALWVSVPMKWLHLRRPLRRTTLAERFGAQESYTVSQRLSVATSNVAAVFEPLRWAFVNPLAKVNAAICEGMLFPLEIVVPEIVRRDHRELTGQRGRSSSLHSPALTAASNRLRRAARRPVKPAVKTVGEPISLAPAFLIGIHGLTWFTIVSHNGDISSMSTIATAWVSTYAVWLGASLVYGVYLVARNIDVRGPLRPASELS